MATLQIRKKSLKTWLHIDSIHGEFILSKFYFSEDVSYFQIVEQGQSKRRKYAVTDIIVFDDTASSTPETFSTITALSLRLEELFYPAFDFSGGISEFTEDEINAIHNSNSPSASNPFATIDDIEGGGVIYIEKTISEIDALIPINGLEKGATYKISGCDTSLYGGTTLILEAIENNRLSESGTGIFYTPKYVQEVAGFNVWSDANTYAIDDLVHWGGKTWSNLNGNVGTSIDIFTLDDTEWESLPFNDVDYNIQYDEIKYDYENDLIDFRYDSLKNKISANIHQILDDKNPIKAFQWGNSVVNNIEIDRGYNEIINFRGTSLEYLTFEFQSIQFDIVYGTSSSQVGLIFKAGASQQEVVLEGLQYDIVFGENSSQNGLTIPSGLSQGNIVFDNILLNRGSEILSTDEIGLTFKGELPEATTPETIFVREGDQMKEYPFGGGGGGTPDLQDVLDAGNTAINQSVNLEFEDYIGEFTSNAAQLSNTSFAEKLWTYFQGIVWSNFANTKSNTLFFPKASTGDCVFGFPDKPTGDYILATTDDIISGSTDWKKTILTKTADYTLANTDCTSNGLIRLNSSSAINLFIESFSVVPIPVGSQIEVVNINTGLGTISQGSGGGTAINWTGYTTIKPNQRVLLTHIATDSWLVESFQKTETPTSGSTDAAESGAVHAALAGKENISNKSDDIETNKASSSIYTSAKAVVDWIKNFLISNLSTKSSLVDADGFVIGDSADSNKTKILSWANFKTLFKTINGFSIFGSGDITIAVPSSTGVYMMANVASDISGYATLPDLDSFTAGSTFTTTPVAISTSGVTLHKFSTLALGLTKIPSGVMTIKFITTKSSGTIAYYAYCKIYKRSSGGTETLLFTSSSSAQSQVNSPVNQEVSVIIPDPVDILSTDRIIVEVICVSASGTPSISMSYDGTTGARVMTTKAQVGYTPENVANKQDSLDVDGTGTKYPTVDALNARLPKIWVYNIASNVVEVDTTEMGISVGKSGDDIAFYHTNEMIEGNTNIDFDVRFSADYESELKWLISNLGSYTSSAVLYRLYDLSTTGSNATTATMESGTIKVEIYP